MSGFAVWTEFYHELTDYIYIDTQNWSPKGHDTLPIRSLECGDLLLEATARHTR